MMPQSVFPELNKALPRDCMVTLDAGVATGLAYDRLRFEEPRTMFNYAGQGGLGMGLCVGLGTKLGRPDRAAISIQGDGGFLYTSQELNTAVRFGIPLVSIVLNNSCHGAEKAQQERLFDGRFIGVDLVNPRFDQLAEVYGARGFFIEPTVFDGVTPEMRAAAPRVAGRAWASLERASMDRAGMASKSRSAGRCRDSSRRKARISASWRSRYPAYRASISSCRAICGAIAPTSGQRTARRSMSMSG